MANKNEVAFNKYVEEVVDSYIEHVILIVKKVKEYNIDIDNQAEWSLLNMVESSMWKHVNYINEAQKIADKVFGKKINYDNEISKLIEITEQIEIIDKDGTLELPHGVTIDELLSAVRNKIKKESTE